MKRILFWVRLSGYVTGLLGMAVMLTVPRIPLTYAHRQLSRGIGAGLLTIMFLCFLTGYVLYTVRILRRRSGVTRPTPGESPR